MRKGGDRLKPVASTSQQRIFELVICREKVGLASSKFFEILHFALKTLEDKMLRAVLKLEIVVDRAAFWFWRNLNTFTTVVTLNQSSVCVSSGYAISAL